MVKKKGKRFLVGLREVKGNDLVILIVYWRLLSMLMGFG